MNYAKHKTAINKSWGDSLIAMSVITNMFCCGLVISQNCDIIDNQQTIINNQSNITTAINDSKECITEQIENNTITKFKIAEDISTEQSSFDDEIESKLQTNDFMNIPNYDTSFKTYMDYRCITDKTSAQYMLQIDAYTDDMGLRKYGNYYIVAMGTYYSDNIGDTFKITLDNDTSFNVIIGDIKADCHTDSNNMYSPVYNQNGNFVSANVIEFIVDTKKLDRSVKRLGTVSAYDDFKGNIVKIERTDIYE